MNSCLENIVTIRNLCAQSGQPSLSGFDLMDAPEISTVNLAAMANEEYVSGYNLAKSKLTVAITMVLNDFIGLLNRNNIATNIVSKPYTTSVFRAGSNMGTASLERGVTLFKSTKIRGQLRKPKITAIEVYPLVDVPSTYINIHDAGLVYRYPVTLVADQVNSFPIEHVLRGPYARVLVDNTDIPMAGADITCKTGCNGSLPNDCGYAMTFSGSRETDQREGYGINVLFTCFCDYESLLCSMAKTYIGQIIWLKARVLLMEEQLLSGRFNNWIIYGKKELAKYLGQVRGEYEEKWMDFADGLFGIMKQYRDECLDCRGPRVVVNL